MISLHAVKLSHDYFKSYLVRLSDYTTDRCYVCSTKEDSEHLILHCKATQAIRKELKQELYFCEEKSEQLHSRKEKFEVEI